MRQYVKQWRVTKSEGTEAQFRKLFSFTHPATTEIYTLSLHDALPIFLAGRRAAVVTSPGHQRASKLAAGVVSPRAPDRKSTRLNSSHSSISYAVFCLKKKKRHACVLH